MERRTHHEIRLGRAVILPYFFPIDFASSTQKSQNQFSEPPKSTEIVTPERRITKMLLKSARDIPDQIG
jgi:hypothetical protein